MYAPFTLLAFLSIPLMLCTGGCKGGVVNREMKKHLASSSVAPELELHPIHIFRQCIEGDFDNRKQVEEQLVSGKQIHPYIRRVSRVVNSKISNLPEPANTFYVLTEKYYKYADREDTLSISQLLVVERMPQNSVRLQVLLPLQDIHLKNIKHSNSELQLNYRALQAAPLLQLSEYSFDGVSFYSKAIYQPPDGLPMPEETLSTNELKLVEFEILNGKKIRAYDAPVIYTRLM